MGFVSLYPSYRRRLPALWSLGVKPITFLRTRASRRRTARPVLGDRRRAEPNPTGECDDHAIAMIASYSRAASATRVAGGVAVQRVGGT